MDRIEPYHLVLSFDISVRGPGSIYYFFSEMLPQGAWHQVIDNWREIFGNSGWIGKKLIPREILPLTRKNKITVMNCTIWIHTGITGFSPQILHKLLLWNTRGRSAYSQEHSVTIVYAKFGGQTECIMGNWKIENGQRSSSLLKLFSIFRSMYVSIFAWALVLSRWIRFIPGSMYENVVWVCNLDSQPCFEWSCFPVATVFPSYRKQPFDLKSNLPNQ